MTIKRGAVKYTVFLRWWLYFTLICVGMFILNEFSMFQRLYGADITKISFGIIFLFFIFTIRVGIDTFRVSKIGENISKEQIKEFFQKNERRWFVASIFEKLGILGTVAGLIYVLEKSFFGIEFSDINSLSGTISTMALGMGTALYTTATGIVFRVLLEIQAFNLDQFLDRLSYKENEKII